MNKMKIVSPHSLEGDLGWHLRDAFSEAMKDLNRYALHDDTWFENLFLV